MSLQFTKNKDIFKSDKQTIVNPVNLVGVMGGGLAKVFKERYPAMFKEYKEHCDSNEFTLGSLHLYDAPDKKILNFPTKVDWQDDSKYQYIEIGLRTFVLNYETMGITSICFPALGCGLGSLDWELVKFLMEMHLSDLDIPIEVIEPI